MELYVILPGKPHSVEMLAESKEMTEWVVEHGSYGQQLSSPGQFLKGKFLADVLFLTLTSPCPLLVVPSYMEITSSD